MTVFCILYGVFRKNNFCFFRLHCNTSEM